MTDSNLTHLVFVLDRSGSMASNDKAVEAERGVRAMVDEQKKLPGRLELTIARFDEKYDLLAESVDANNFNGDHLKIQPRGMTALRDAVCRTVNSVGQRLAARPEHERPGRVAFVVATDGLENASQEFSPEQMKTMLTEQSNKYGWDFIFMGTSREAVLQAQDYGFSAKTSYASSDTSAGIASGYATASNSLRTARYAGAGVRLVVSEEDRKKLK